MVRIPARSLEYVLLTEPAEGSTMTSLTRTCRGTRGFTLIEVLTAVGMAGVISAIAVTNFRAFIPGYRTRGAALEIAGDMNHARLSAVERSRLYSFVPLSGARYEIRSTASDGTVTVVKQVNVAADFPGVQFGATGIASDPYGNAIASAVPVGPVLFHSNGTVTNAASVFVEPTTECEHCQHGVVVTAAGRIRVWHYNGSVWN